MKNHPGSLIVSGVVISYYPASSLEMISAERFPDEMTLSLYEEDGIQYMFGEAEDLNYSSVVWYQQGYVFLITGDLPKNELLKLCKTLKIEESE